MARYVRNPTECDAFVIDSVDDPTPEGMRLVHCKGGMLIFVTPAQTSRYIPKEGDYVVVSATDSYTYLNPKDVFERNWHPWSPADAPPPKTVPPPAPDKNE